MTLKLLKLFMKFNKRKRGSGRRGQRRQIPRRRRKMKVSAEDSYRYTKIREPAL